MSDIKNAIKHLCEEKNLEYDSVLGAIELSLAAAYRKDYGEKNQNIRVEFDPDTGKSKVFDVKTVVENLSKEEEEAMLENLYGSKDKDAKAEKKEDAEKKEEKKDEKDEKKEDGAEEDEEEKRRFNPKTDIQLKEAVILKHDAKIGDEIVTELPIPESYGRMAAQTAKQVIVQKLREMERDMVFGEFKNKEFEVVSGIVQRREGRFVFVDLGKAIGFLPAEEQIYSERYNVGDRLKFYIKEVREGHKGPEIVLSRRSEEILRKVFYLEIPEIANGTVEIKSIAREAGSRSKVAIYTESENVDPVGSCVGQRGSRIQTIITELGGEKIDIIEYDEEPARFIANALAPAKVLNIELHESEEEERKAEVKVSSDKLSLAIGKNGQNVRLAARLTGWKIDIIEAGEDGEKIVVKDSEIKSDVSEEEGENENKEEDKEKKKEDDKEETEKKKETEENDKEEGEEEKEEEKK